MTIRPRQTVPRDLPVAFHLLGTIPWHNGMALVHRLAAAAVQSDEPRVTVLLCEHPEVITVGRSGSRVDIKIPRSELSNRGLTTHWVSRGGGAVLHAPGQLAVYPLVPLAAADLTVGEFLRRFFAAVQNAFESFGVQTAATAQPPLSAIYGRTGPLASFGVSVKQGVTLQGVFVSVNPSMQLQRLVDATPPDENGRRSLSCLTAERGASVNMPKVRSALVQSMSEAFEWSTYHLLTGHPDLDLAPFSTDPHSIPPNERTIRRAS